MGIDIDKFIEGIPYPKDKVMGDVQAAKKWTQVVQQATAGFPKVKGAVNMNLTFVLPENKYPTDHPYGPDLDNLVKRFFDALNTTVFSMVPGMDGAVVKLTVSKRKVRKGKPTGARMILNEL